MRGGVQKKYEKAVRFLQAGGMAASDARAQALKLAKTVNMGAWLEKQANRRARGRRVQFNG